MNYYEMISAAEVIARKEMEMGNLGGIADIIRDKIPEISKGMSMRVATEVLRKGLNYELCD